MGRYHAQIGCARNGQLIMSILKPAIPLAFKILLGRIMHQPDDTTLRIDCNKTVAYRDQDLGLGHAYMVKFIFFRLHCQGMLYQLLTGASRAADLGQDPVGELTIMLPGWMNPLHVFIVYFINQVNSLAGWICPNLALDLVRGGHDMPYD